jgi:predicted RNA-binding Zn-ribbon protein involved in translation (DUF1610 family)
MTDSKSSPSPAACPSCGGAFVVDASQDPARLIDRKQRNAQSPVAAQRFAHAVTTKAAEHGVIHRCARCGYRARFHATTRAA